MNIVDTLPPILRERFYKDRFKMEAEVLAEAGRGAFLSHNLAEKLAVKVQHFADGSVSSVAIVFNPDKVPPPTPVPPWPAAPPDFSDNPATPRPAPAAVAPRATSPNRPTPVVRQNPAGQVVSVTFPASLPALSNSQLRQENADSLWHGLRNTGTPQ